MVHSIVGVNLKNEHVVYVVLFPNLDAQARSEQSHNNLNSHKEHVNAATELRGG